MGERIAAAAKRSAYLAFAFGAGLLTSCGACSGSGAGSGSGEAGALLPDPAGTCNGAGGCILDTDPSDGIGRWPAKDGANANLGYYGSDFGDALWDWYKAR